MMQDGGTMPFMPGANPFMSGSPFGSGGVPPMFNKKTENSFNVDDLVKRIDAKIAELEAEEAMEKEQNKSIEDIVKETHNKKQETIDEIIDDFDVPVSKEKQGITDDQFFDDFFNDE